MIRAVFDTTVLVSAFRSRRGVTGELVRLAGVTFDLFLSPEIIAETREVLLGRPRLRRGARYTDDDVHAYIRELQVLATVVSDLPPIEGVVRDPNDDVIVAAAVEAQADHLVTRDKDLLSLGSYQKIRMITPEAFRGILRET